MTLIPKPLSLLSSYYPTFNPFSGELLMEQNSLLSNKHFHGDFLGSVGLNCFLPWAPRAPSLLIVNINKLRLLSTCYLVGIVLSTFTHFIFLTTHHASAIVTPFYKWENQDILGWSGEGSRVALAKRFSEAIVNWRKTSSDIVRSSQNQGNNETHKLKQTNEMRLPKSPISKGKYRCQELVWKKG